MTSGASDADIGILMIDAVDGIQAQTSGHLKILSILGVRDVVVAVNKMDKVGYDQAAFQHQSDLADNLLASLELRCAGVIPVCALKGENIVQSSTKMPWYSGPSLLEALCITTLQHRERHAEPFRMLLQDVYKFEDDRYFVGRVVSGSITPGKMVYFSPSGRSSRIQSIARFPDMARLSATSGESVALKLSEQIFVERGEIISPPDQAPEVGTKFEARLVWLSQEPLRFDLSYILKIGTAQTTCTVTALNPDLADEPIVNGCVVDLIVTTSEPVAFERTSEGGNLNRFVICSPYDTVAAGVIKLEQQSESRAPVKFLVQVETGYLSRVEREKLQGHKAAVLWLTGLSGAGKSTLAKAIERELFENNRRVIALDADTMRTGLCVDLGFSAEERAENIRRIAEVAKLCMDSGSIVIVACLSPYRKDRELARQIIGPEYFKEIFVSCPIEICQSRDPKGLYRKVAQGQLKSLSGLDSPYQPPLQPDLVIDSTDLTLTQEVKAIVSLLRDNSVID
jgi:bifunctional enzyme CysN/CysC